MRYRFSSCCAPLAVFWGIGVLARFSWTLVMICFSGAIILCFLGRIAFGVSCAVFLLPLSGLFMSMICPMLNSKGIHCFAKLEHGTIAGVILLGIFSAQ